MKNVIKFVIDYIGEKYDTKPEYLWEKTPQYCIFRHKKNEKWFAALLKGVPIKSLEVDKSEFNGVSELDLLNLKIDPELGAILKDNKSIISAYHMNKKHWISVVLSVCDKAKITDLIDESFDLTKK